MNSKMRSVEDGFAVNSFLCSWTVKDLAFASNSPIPPETRGFSYKIISSSLHVESAGSMMSSGIYTVTASSPATI